MSRFITSRTPPGCDGATVVETSLPSDGTIVSFTETTNTIPKFSDETPSTAVVAESDEGVRLTGLLRGAANVAIGAEVEIGAEAVDENDWSLTFAST